MKSKLISLFVCFVLPFRGFSQEATKQFYEETTLTRVDDFKNKNYKNGWSNINDCYKAYINEDGKYYLYMPVENGCHWNGANWGFTYADFSPVFSREFDQYNNQELGFQLEFQPDKNVSRLEFGLLFNIHNVTKRDPAGNFFVIMLKYYPKVGTCSISLNKRANKKWSEVETGLSSKPITVRDLNTFKVRKKGMNYTVSFNNIEALNFDYEGDIGFESIYYGSGGKYLIDNVYLKKFQYKTKAVKSSESIAPKGPPKIYALSIGIGDYSGHISNKGRLEKTGFASCVKTPHLPLPCLKSIDHDATAMYDFWQTPNGGLVPKSQLKLLINGSATKKQIIAEAATLFSASTSNDIIILYASGHGGQGLFCTADENLPYEQLNRVIESMEARHKIVLLDACHSGSIKPVFKKSSTEPVSRDEALKLYYNGLLKSSNSIAYLLSCKGDEESLVHSTENNSVFTYFLLEGLKGKADINPKNNLVTLAELIDYLQTSVSQYARNIIDDDTGKPLEQNPELKGRYDSQMPLANVPPQ